MRFMGQGIKTPLGDSGRVEGSSIKIVEENIDDDRASITVVYNASISWPGMTANPMSPGSWKHWNQSAELVNQAGEWKVESFETE